MFSFLKAAVLGIVFALVISAVIGHSGGTGGILNVHYYVIQDVGFYWSWMLFVGGTGLAFLIFIIMA